MNGSARVAASPRVDPKPTRIPKPAASTSPYMNGYANNTDAAYAYRQASLDQAHPQSRALVPSSSTRSTLDLPRNRAGANLTESPSLPISTDSSRRAYNYSSTTSTPASGNAIISESPPFPSSTSNASSGFFEDPPVRQSMESEELPFEHWYRGDVSRNGGVGELRVGRRQEMLDIANYGHLIGKKKAAAAAGGAARDTVLAPPADVGYSKESKRRRKRAGSMSRMERGSLYLDDERAAEVDRVMDENPLTDLEGEGSDVHSLADRWGGGYAYQPEPTTTTTAGAHEIRSTTPTASGSLTHRQHNQNLPPTRIPGPSSRRSSDSKSVGSARTPNPNSNSHSPQQQYALPAGVAQTSSMSSRTQSGHGSSNLNVSTSSTAPSTSTPQKRGVSPSPSAATSAAKKGRTTPTPSSAKKKTPPSANRKGVGKEDKEGKRRSVAQYPTMEGDDDEDMADAIPSWTQPVPREGGWDDVVLPVVARKKGLDGHYEAANGTPQPKKSEVVVAPAPGTFGFDHSKYRPPALNDEFIPLDEFGRPQEQQRPQQQPPSEDKSQSAEEPADQQERHDTRRRTRDSHSDVPIRIPPSPSPAPFAHYAGTPTVDAYPHAKGGDARDKEEEEGGGGCCKCVVM